MPTEGGMVVEVEVEVESVAFIVCDALGLDSGDYSFAYVARWAGGSTELAKDTAERAVNCARDILEGFTTGADAAPQPGAEPTSRTA